MKQLKPAVRLFFFWALWVRESSWLCRVRLRRKGSSWGLGGPTSKTTPLLSICSLTCFLHHARVLREQRCLGDACPQQPA